MYMNDNTLYYYYILFWWDTSDWFIHKFHRWLVDRLVRWLVGDVIMLLCYEERLSITSRHYSVCMVMVVQSVTATDRDLWLVSGAKKHSPRSWFTHCCLHLIDRLIDWLIIFVTLDKHCFDMIAQSTTLQYPQFAYQPQTSWWSVI